MKRLIFLFMFSIMSLVSFGQVDTLYACGYQNSSQVLHSTLNCKNAKDFNTKYAVKDITNAYQLNRHFKCRLCMPRTLTDSIKTEIYKREYEKTLTSLGVTTYNEKHIRSESERIRSKILHNEMLNNELYKSGEYLRKSAILNYTSIGLCIMGATIGTIPAYNTKISDEGTKACIAVGSIMGVASLITEICAINYKFKAGQSLKISANRIQYNF